MLGFLRLLLLYFPLRFLWHYIPFIPAFSVLFLVSNEFDSLLIGPASRVIKLANSVVETNLYWERKSIAQVVEPDDLDMMAFDRY